VQCYNEDSKLSTDWRGVHRKNSRLGHVSLQQKLSRGFNEPR